MASTAPGPSRTGGHAAPATPAPVVVSFVRLPVVPIADITRLLNDPRLTRHMPLSGPMTAEQAAAWVEAKDAQWHENGYGPWAVLVEGAFAGWGGFQQEGADADFALVLDPSFWGHGAAITRNALTRGFTELGLTEVIIALPLSRGPVRTLARFGFRADGEVDHGGTRFRRFRLRRADWPPGAVISAGRTGGATPP